MLGEGQVTGAQVGWSEAAMAAGEPAVDEPVVREKEPVAKGCVVGFVGHGELRFDWQHFCCFSLLLLLYY
jgi:hypothetical protein